MNNLQFKSPIIFALLVVLMAATRFSHFGSAVTLPDASLAVFFLGGLYLARSTRLSMVAFCVLIVMAGLIDYSATSIQGISDWCMTPAYWFLLPTYGSLWFAGSWFALRYKMQGKGLLGLAMLAWLACSFAFMFSNATFYLFSGSFDAMSAAEYTSRVSQYYGSYVSVALLYIACAIALHMMFDMLAKQHTQPRSEVV